MVDQNLIHLRDFLKILNDLPFLRLHRKYRGVRFKTDMSSVKKMYGGVQFAFITIWKIYLIQQVRGLSKSQRIEYIRMLPDPIGKPFFSERTAKRLNGKSRQLGKFFKKPGINL